MAAFNAGTFRKNEEVVKFVDLDADEAHCYGVPALQPEISGVIVELGEAGRLLVLPGSCLQSFVCHSEPNWVEASSEEAELGKMVRERMPCRRGRGARRARAARGPAAALHHHCCCVYCHRRAGAPQVQPSQYVEAGGSSNGEQSLPAFGSVIFSLRNPRENLGINAHISVLFTRIPDENEAGLPRPPAMEHPLDTEQRIHPAREGNLPLAMEEECRLVDKGKRPLGEASSSREAELREKEPELPAFMDGLPEGHGWAWIREAKPGEDEPEDDEQEG